MLPYHFTSCLLSRLNRYVNRNIYPVEKDSLSHAILYSAFLVLGFFENAIFAQNMYISTIYIFHTSCQCLPVLPAENFCSGRCKVNLKKSFQEPFQVNALTDLALLRRGGVQKRIQLCIATFSAEWSYL